MREDWIVGQGDSESAARREQKSSLGSGKWHPRVGHEHLAAVDHLERQPSFPEVAGPSSVLIAVLRDLSPEGTAE